MIEQAGVPGTDPLLAFQAPQVGFAVVNASLLPQPHAAEYATTASACAEACLEEIRCIAFTFSDAHPPCDLAGWSDRYDVARATSQAAYYYRNFDDPASQQPVKPAVSYPLEAPTAGVQLLPPSSTRAPQAVAASVWQRAGVWGTAFGANLKYLSQFPVDDMLFWFRRRHGDTTPPGASWGWDHAGPDKPFGLKGSVAGAFLMGAGGALRWPLPQASLVALNASVGWTSLASGLGANLSDVLRGVAGAQQPDGYIMAFPVNESFYLENPNYVTSWLCHGLLEAHTALPHINGAAQAPVDPALPLQLLRAHLDWFHASATTPRFLPPRGNTTGPQWSDEGDPQQQHGHLIYLIYQGIIHHTRTALSPVGVVADAQRAAARYAEPWWLAQLASKDPAAVWLKSYYPHNYEITAIEAYLDLYQITGDATLYLTAVDGFVEVFGRDFMHVGGSVAIKENKLYPPRSFYLDTTGNYLPQPRVLLPHAYARRIADTIPYLLTRVCASHACTRLYRELPGEDAKAQQKAHQNCTRDVAWAASGGDVQQCWHSTGELCGQAFWVKLMQRLHRLRPETELYAANIEKTLLNGVVGQIPPDGRGIRQFTVLHKVKMIADNNSTCCEGQGTRVLGSLPEYIFSLPAAKAPASRGGAGLADVYVNQFVPSRIELPPRPEACTGAGALNLTLQTAWPYENDVNLTLSACEPVGAGSGGSSSYTVAIRAPSWLDTDLLQFSIFCGEGGAAAHGGLAPRGGFTHIDLGAQCSNPGGGWASARVSFTLQPALRVSQYTGFTKIAKQRESAAEQQQQHAPAREHYQRFAVEYGPVLLVARGPWNASTDSIHVHGVANPASTPPSWLQRDNGAGLRFTVAGNDALDFVPYYEVQEEQFEVYPVFDDAAN
jgi:hypothetical protein